MRMMKSTRRKKNDSIEPGVYLCLKANWKSYLKIFRAIDACYRNKWHKTCFTPQDASNRI